MTKVPPLIAVEPTKKTTERDPPAEMTRVEYLEYF
jgi:hypothetical protein